jgi:hypothetical protein
MISGETGPRRVRVYNQQGWLIREYWEGVTSHGVAVGAPKLNASVSVETTTRGNFAVGLEVEAPVSEIEVQVSQDEFGATVYFDSPAWMRRFVKFCVKAGSPVAEPALRFS